MRNSTWINKNKKIKKVKLKKKKKTVYTLSVKMLNRNRSRSLPISWCVSLLFNWVQWSGASLTVDVHSHHTRELL